eukprot:7217660-Alexandrium_andersonii.AAC.1
MFWNSSEQEAKSASTAARVSWTELPCAWSSARAWAIRLVTAELAPSVSVRWGASRPTSLPTNADWRS